MRHFALHDPEATDLEKEAALRLGETKNSGDDDEEDDEFDYLEHSKEQDQQVLIYLLFIF